MIREKCVLCQSDISEYFRIKSMPVFMGVVDSNESILKEDLVFGECVKCGLIQNLILIDPGILYMNNHNTEVIGEIWQNHYQEFSDFIKKKSKGDVVLEIGDPSLKLASKLKNFYKKWIIVEPNTDLENHDNIEIIKSFFNGHNPTDYKINTIVHSHVFEHIYEPLEFLKDCHRILDEDGVIIFSIPNLKWILDNNSLPTSVLHFEHTYFINSDNIHFFLNKSGFQLDELIKYKNHSLFVRATKKKNIEEIQTQSFEYSKMFLSLVEYFNEKIVEINYRLKDSEYYLYSAHINSQYLLSNGISKNIKGLLDNAKSKIGKKLYGYEFEIFSPDILKEEEHPIVVASNMGVYFEEIKSNLLSINKNCIIL